MNVGTVVGSGLTLLLMALPLIADVRLLQLELELLCAVVLEVTLAQLEAGRDKQCS